LKLWQSLTWRIQMNPYMSGGYEGSILKLSGL
jgi:hypothetical protein